MEKQMETIKMIDTSINVPEHKAWNMRPRDKSHEIAPDLHFNSHFQTERIVSSIQRANYSTFIPTDVL